MTEYLPVIRRPGIRMPWGYFVSPLDTTMCLPDKEKLEALNYAFRMKAKYGTSLRDCMMWLHAATGQRITHNGFANLYKKWFNRIRKENMTRIQALKKQKLKEDEQFIKDNLKHLSVILNDTAAVAAVAHKEAREAWKKKDPTAAG